MDEEIKYTESDIYVRDQLLIQFMLDKYVDDVLDVEEVYDHWISWLKEMEERNAKRSKI